MELVRFYVKKGFQTVKTIKSQDVDRIVDRYLQGDDMQTIAKEEAKRIRNDFREQSLSTPETENVPEQEFQIERSLLRPPPQDINVPEGYERRGGMIVPQRPKRPQGRIEGQKEEETFDEAVVRLRKLEKTYNKLAIIVFSVIGLLTVAGIIAAALQ